MKRILVIICLIASMTGIVPAYALDNQPESLSLDQAIELALKNNRTIKDAHLELEKAKVTADEANDAVDYVPIGPNYDSGVAALYTNYLWSDYRYQVQKKNYEFQKKALVADVTAIYLDTVNTKKKLENIKYEIEKSERQYLQYIAKQNVGLATSLEVENAKTKFIVEKTNAKDLQSKFDNAYLKLNLFIGKSPDSRYELDGEVEFSKLEDKDIQTYYNKAVAHYPEIYAKEQSASVGEIAKEFASIYRVGELEAKQYALKATQTKENLQQDIQNLVLSIDTLEKAYETSKQAVATAEEAYRVQKVMYDAGMITIDKVIESKSSLEKAKVDYQDTIFKHKIAKSKLMCLTGDLKINQ